MVIQFHLLFKRYQRSGFPVNSSREKLQHFDNLACSGFYVGSIVTDNRFSNVYAFSLLASLFVTDCSLFMKHPLSHGKQMCMFSDAVHLVKNTQNNLLHGKKFIFPDFTYDDQLYIWLNCPAGYISWEDLHTLYDKDKKLKGNLRKAPKLSYQALHSGNYKQNVPLFHDSTIVAAKSSTLIDQTFLILWQFSKLGWRYSKQLKTTVFT